MRILLVVWIIIVPFCLSGKNHNNFLDSTKNLINMNSTVEEKISVHMRRIAYCQRNPVDSTTFFKVVEEFENEKDCPDCQYLARNSIGHFYYANNDIEKSIKYFNQSKNESKFICDKAYNNSHCTNTTI